MAIAKKILGKAIKKTRQEFGKPKVKKPIKISKAETKANKRGLKAANKPVSKNKEKVYNLDKNLKKSGLLKPGETSYYTRNQLMNVIKPARPNRTRGGNLRGE